MSSLSFPLISLVVVVPFILAALAQRFGSISRKALSALAVLPVSLVGALLLTFEASGSKLLFDPIALGGVSPIGVDALSISLMLAASLLVLFAVLAASKRECAPHVLLSLFAVEGLVFATFSARDTNLLLGSWAAVSLPVWWATRGGSSRAASRLTAIFLVGSALPALAVALLHRGRADAVVIIAVLVGAVGRMGLFPLHAWLAPVLSTTRAPAALPILACSTGPYLLTRFSNDIVRGPFEQGLALSGAIAVVAAVYAALLALGERRLSYSTAYIVMSESAIVFAGICTGEHEAMRGALLFSLAQCFAASGLVVAARAVEARVGEVDLRQHHGLYATTPKLASVFLICSLATVGFPGFAGYIGEDLLLSGELHRQLEIGIVLAAIAALNGITVFRAYARTFLGPERVALRAAPDLLPHKRALFVALVLAQVVFGLLPVSLLHHLSVEQAPQAAHH